MEIVERILSLRFSFKFFSITMSEACVWQALWGTMQKNIFVYNALTRECRIMPKLIIDCTQLV